MEMEPCPDVKGYQEVNDWMDKEPATPEEIDGSILRMLERIASIRIWHDHRKHSAALAIVWSTR